MVKKAKSQPKNQLFYGDNLEVLRKHIKDESVDLCYIDPPFNSKRNYNQIYNNIGKEDQAQAQAFIDTWTWDDLANQGLAEIQENYLGHFTSQSIDLISGLVKVLGKGSLLAYLVSMTLRIAEIYRVLKPTGSFYLHCDPSSSHYLKIIIDAIFCAQGGNYLNEIVWKRTTSHNDAKKNFSNLNDIIYFYSKGSQHKFNKQYTSYDDQYIAKNFRHIDEKGRRYSSENLRSPNPRPNLTYDYKGYKPHPNGWTVSREKMEQLDKDGRLIFPRSHEGRIRIKKYLDEMSGITVGNNWTDIFPISSQAAERLGYPTQKPEALLERIIQASSNEGDIAVLLLMRYS